MIDSDGILRHKDGEIVAADLDTLWNLCPVNTHIPTVRELADDAQSKGAKGNLGNIQFPVSPDQIPPESQMIFTIDRDGHEDSFYFGAKGYKRPDNDLGKYKFWTSSCVSNDCHNNNYYFNGAKGDFGDAITVQNYFAVRCFPDPARKE